MKGTGLPACTVAVLFLQPECNMHCDFCVTEDDFEALDPALGRELCVALARRGVRTVTLGGGEPFTWPGDVLALGRYAQEQGLHVQIGTNAVRLPEDFATAAGVDRYVLPLESTEAAVHNSLRHWSCPKQPGGHHALILRRLEALGRAGRSVTLSTVVTARNEAGLDQLGEWLAAYARRFGNVHAWHLYRFLPLGRGGRIHRESLDLPEPRYRELVARQASRDLPFRLYRRSDMYRPREVEFFWQEGGRIRWGSSQLRGEGSGPGTQASERESR